MSIETPLPLRKEDGYRGIWSFNGSALSGDEFRYTHYSGGFATAFAKHIPMAIYAEEVNKTFFCYAGTPRDGQQIQIMVSFFDHTTGTLPRPTLLMDKGTDDAHDNPVIMLDDAGFVWVFPSAHGNTRSAFIYRSCAPYDIDAFELIQETSFSYPQPWHLAGRGFIFLHTRYEDGGRSLYWMTSVDGRRWEKPLRLSRIDLGHYQVSWRWKDKVGTAFNYHPTQRLLNDFRRTSLYYLETDDFGETWRNADGAEIAVPLADVVNDALVHDYESEELRVYVKDLNFDAEGHPVILYLTSRGAHSGPENDPRVWMAARWCGSHWERKEITRSDNNYDAGCLHVEEDTWRVIGPTEPGPQRYNTGGEMALWISNDRGESWKRDQLITADSEFNHTFACRPVNAHPDFHAFWADGHAREESESRLYFCDRTGEMVYRMPPVMSRDVGEPEAV